jgi:hypothetical protein
VIIPGDVLAGVADGSLDLAFRRWERPRVRAGTRMRTAIGLVEVVDVRVVDPEEVDDAQARRAGAPSREALLAASAPWADRPLHRIVLRAAGPDPRVALRERADIAPDELGELRRRLARMDARSQAPWTRGTLALIRDRPGVRAGDLAAAAGRDRLPFKAGVRRLKELGLTESLPVGYRLSPRGARLLQLLEEPAGP